MTQQQPHDEPPTQPPDEQPGEQLVLTSPEDAQTPKDLALWAGVILLTALTVYSPALRGDFLWDDDRHVSMNRNLRDFPGLVNIWTRLGLQNGGTIQYYPLTHTTFWLEYQLSGAQPGQINPIVFHTTNVVLHVIGAILLWLVLRELKVPGSWVAAAAWALHPIQVESVAWMSERKNVLAGVFFFGSILAYLRSSMGLKGDRRTWDGAYGLALGLFACALLSKTVSASVPAVILLLLWWKRGLGGKDVLATLPMFLLGAGMAYLTSQIEHGQVGARGEEWAIPFAQRVLVAGRAVWFYVEKNLLPLKLTFIYPRWNVPNLPASWWMFPLAVVAVIGVLFSLRRRIGRGPVVAFAIFCGVLTPALGFINFYPMRYSFVADHFQYLAGPALIALIVAGATVLMRRVAGGAAAAPYVAAGLVLVILSALTLIQSRIYASQQALWADAVAKNPGSAMLQYNYGTSLLRMSDTLEPEDAATALDQSMERFARAIEIQPKHDRAWNNWGQALLLRGKHAEAIEKFDKSIAINVAAGTVNIDPIIGRAKAMYDAGRMEDSRRAFDDSLAAAMKLRGTGAVERIEVATVYQYLGRIAVRQDDLEAARRHYAEAVNVVGNASIIRYEYGELLVRMARLAMGLPATRPTTAPTTMVRPVAPATSQAATIPTTGPASTQPASQPADKAKQLMAAAAVEFASAIEVRPDYIDARVALANLMMDVGNLTGARAQLTAAVQVFRSLNTGGTYPPLEEAVRRWDAEFRQVEAAATRPTTTRAATGPGTSITSEVISAPTTRPASQ